MIPMKKGKKILIFIVSIMVILLITVNGFFVYYLNSPSMKAKEQLELAQNYLLDLEYEQAVAAFDLVIELDPKNTDAYLGLAEAYLQLGKPEKALKTLQRGYDETEDEIFWDMIKELEQQLNREQTDLNIVQIDTTQYPNITVYFSLQDLYGNYIQDVSQEQIKVLEAENEEWKEVTGNMRVTESNHSMQQSVAFVMDVSGSMDNLIDEEAQAAQSLLEEMKRSGNYKVSLTTFSSNWNLLNDYTTDLDAVFNNLNGLRTGGGTALYDTLENTLYETLKQQGQRYILAFTDGEDSGSRISKEELVSLAQYYHVPIYIIAAMQEGYVTDQMKEIAHESGGKLYSITSMDDLYDIYYEIFQIQENLHSYTYETKQFNTKSGIRVVYESKKYIGEGESTFLSQKPVKRERINNSIIDDIELSSSLSLENNESSVKALLDNRLDTMWIEGAPGNGIGEYLNIVFDEAHAMNGVEIYHGNRVRPDIYEKYNRIKKVRLIFSDGTTKEYELQDSFFESSKIEFVEPVTTTMVKIEILDVYQGTTYKDTCISEILIN